MCEPSPLRGKKARYLSARQCMVDCFKFEDIQSAVEFYRKYSNALEGTSTILKEDYPSIYKEWQKYKKKNKDAWYMSWLFDYCFGDVIE